MEEFALTIKLGNEAMQEPADIAEALERVAAQLRDDSRTSARVMDLNGNAVGTWELR